MKIGILTQPLHNNYGGILQNYALQQILKTMGHDVCTLDILYQQKHTPLLSGIAHTLWRFVKKCRGDKSFVFCNTDKEYRFLTTPGKEQKRFISENISIKHYQNYLTTESVDYGYDAFVVGSDQVWRPRFSPYFPNYFLDFAEERNVKRISYAASYGTNKWEGDEQETKMATRLLKMFNFVSVRESSGIDLCSSTFGVNAECVLDPTLLLKREDYISLTENCNIKHTNAYLAVYVLDVTPSIDKLIKNICSSKNLEPIYLGRPSKKGFPSIESWLDGIMNAEYVLTDSFHGTAFSINFHKQFTTVVNNGRGADRFTSLLGKLNIMDRLIDSETEINFTNEINYEDVEKQLNELREQSMSFLNRSING